MLRHYFNAPPLLKEKLPRLPWPAVANHRVAMLDPTHGASGSPPPHPPVSPVSPPPHRSLGRSLGAPAPGHLVVG